VGLSSNHRSEDWTLDEVMKSTEEHVVFTWTATDPTRKAAKDFKRGEGIYLYDYAGNKFIDFSS
jgi:taurine---2-oxoglutarate transaminase